MESSMVSALAAALPFGKTLPDARYVHTCGLSVLPEEYTAVVARASELAGAKTDAFNVIRFDLTANRLSLLSYPSFFEEGFPSLAASWTVDFDEPRATARSYDPDENPPILHRKELLLPPSHPLSGTFQALTREAERAGLLEDPGAIGRRSAWEARLRRVGLVVRGNQLAEAGSSNSASEAEVSRHKTALVRYSLSSPMQQLWRHGYLDGHHSVFDYGCGRGDDVDALVNRGLTAAGWDPHFRSTSARKTADVVNLGFVLNVIEDPEERAEALSGAWDLTGQVLAVSVILGGKSVYERFRLFRDGVMTRAGTFQKYFKQSELREYVSSTLDREPISIAPGIVFVFKDDREEQSFLAERELTRRPSTALPQVPRTHPGPRERQPSRWQVNAELVDTFWNRCVELGRIPDPDEFEQASDLRNGLGSAKSVYRRCVAERGEEAVKTRRAERMADRQVYLALNQFEARRSFGSLPESVRRDTRAFWGSYSEASQEAKTLLYSIGSPEVLFTACRDAAERQLGYLDGQRSFTFHSSVMHELPAPLRVYLGCAARIYGEFEQVDLIKIHIGSGKVSIMVYDDFEGRPIPMLMERTKILLGAADYDVFSYGDEFPPTPLYLKGRYLPKGFPRRDEQLAFDAKFVEVTGLELIEHGPSAADLHAMLEALGLEVYGFRLRRRPGNRHSPATSRASALRSESPGRLEDSDDGVTLANQSKETQVTILEAAIRVLRDHDQPMSVADIYDAILRDGLYQFNAKSPRSVLSGTLKNHVKKSSNPLVVEASSGTYRLA